MIFKSEGFTSALIFWHIEKGITFDDAPKSTIQLCTFLLKISKINKKEGTFFHAETTKFCWFFIVVPQIVLSKFPTVFSENSLLS